MAGLFSHGTVTKINSVAVGGVTGITPFERTRGEIQVTDADSGFDHEFIPGLRNAGGATLDFNVITGDAGQAELINSYEESEAEDSVVELEITLPNGTTITADVFVTSLSWSLPQDTDEKASGSATLKIAKNLTITLST